MSSQSFREVSLFVADREIHIAIGSSGAWRESVQVIMGEG